MPYRRKRELFHQQEIGLVALKGVGSISVIIGDPGALEHPESTHILLISSPGSFMYVSQACGIFVMLPVRPTLLQSTQKQTVSQS